MVKKKSCCCIALLLCLTLCGFHSAAQTRDTVTIVAVGDIQLGTIYPDTSYLPSEAVLKGYFTEVKPYFGNADIVFCNMEGVFADSLVEECKSFCFGMPSRYVRYYKDAGFNLISVGNNHSNDFRAYGRENTAKILNENRLHWAGYQTKPKAVFTKGGVRYGFCAFSPNTSIMNLHNYTQMQAIVRELDSLCDIVIVSMHCGGEGAGYQHVTRKCDYYIEQNRGNAYEFAHLAIDAGADVVLGHGPHVTRGVEVYQGRLIVYSMGNFATYSQINISGKMGVAPIFRIKVDGNTGEFMGAQVIPTCQSKSGMGPHYDSKKQAIKIIKELSAADFKDNPPSISDEGFVSKP